MIQDYQNKYVSEHALISPDAVIDEKAQISAFAVIHKNVKIGAGTTISSGTIIHENTIIGSENFIGENCIIGALPQDIHFKPETPTGVKIGNNNTIRELSTIHRATEPEKYTEIGHNNFLMAVTHLAHDVKIYNNVIMANNVLLGGFVTVESGAFISGGAAVHQFTRIGRNVMIGGITKLVQDAPPFTTIDGNPGRFKGLNNIGLRRSGFSAAERKIISDFYKKLYNKTSNYKDNLNTIEKETDLSEPLNREIYDFVKKSIKGRGFIAKL